MTEPTNDWLLELPLDGRRDPADAFVGASPAATAAQGACRVLVDGVVHDVAGDPAEHVLRAYRRGGEAGLAQLRGAYAVVVWDGDRDLVIGVRDPMGLHPLFWAQLDGRLLLSSSFSALRSHQLVRGDPDPVVLAEFVGYRFHDAHETVVRAIRRVPPGHLVRAAGRRVATTRWWQPGPRGPEDVVTEAGIEEFAALFTRAVERSLSPGRPGIFLSGGLDSVSVAALAREHAQAAGSEPPWGLSLAFPDPEANEEDVQRGVAQRLGLPHHMIGLEEAVQPLGVLRTAVAASREWPAPLSNYWAPAYERLARDGRDLGCRVILTGTGGDEWLGVTPYYAADLLRRGDLRGLVRLWSNHRRSYPLGSVVIARNMLWRFGARDLLAGRATRALERFAPGGLRARRRRRLAERTPAWLVPEPALARELDDRALAAVAPRVTGSLYWREIQESLDHPLVAIEVEETYESGRRSGLPYAAPFWDADLVSFLIRTPPDLLNRGGRSKGVVRELVAERLPGFGFERQRKVSGTAVATNTVLQGAKQAWEDLGGVPHLTMHGIVDHDALASEVNRIVAERDAVHAYRLWYVFTVEAWLQSQTTTRSTRG